MNADDTSLLCSSKNIYKLIGKVKIELGKINSLFVANQLIINGSKTKCMVFHRNNELVPTIFPPVYIKRILQESTFVRTFGSGFRYKFQIQRLCS